MRRSPFHYTEKLFDYDLDPTPIGQIRCTILLGSYPGDMITMVNPTTWRNPFYYSEKSFNYDLDHIPIKTMIGHCSLLLQRMGTSRL
jgi:hypothetical protein